MQNISKLGIGIVITFFTIWIIGPYSLMNTKKELTTEEQELLSDIPRFNKTDGRDGWELKNRKLHRSDWTGMILNNAQIKNVTFADSKFVGIKFTDTVFYKVDFTIDTKFENAQLHNVTFDHCSIKDMKFLNVKCIDCKFIDTTMEDADLTNVLFSNGKFTRFIDINSGYGDVDFVDTVFRESSLDNEYYDGIMHNVKFFEMTKVYTAFADVDVKDVLFQGGDVDIGIAGGELRNITFDRVVMDGLSFNDQIQASNITLTGVELPSLPLNFDKASVNGLRLVDSKNVVGIWLNESTIKDFVVKNTKDITLVIIDSKIDGDVQYINSPIDGLRIERSEITGLLLNKSMITDFVKIKDTKITNLKLVASPVDLNAKIEVNNVTYSDGDQFPNQ